MKREIIKVWKTYKLVWSYIKEGHKEIVIKCDLNATILNLKSLLCYQTFIYIKPFTIQDDKNKYSIYRCHTYD